MARIPAAEIERLKQEVLVEELARRYGVDLRPHGADRIGLCPFHEDHEPSLVISPSRNLWHCLGACQAGGSSIDWVMKAEGVSFRHAVELLRQGLPKAAIRTAKHSRVPRMEMPINPSAEDQDLLGQVISYYHHTLKESPEALAYLESRGLRHAEAIDRFKLGLANRTLGYRLPLSASKAGSEIRARLQKLGILRQSGHEHFNGCLVIPILDENGRVLEVYGRRVSRVRGGSGIDHLYLPGPHHGLFNVEAIAASEEIILCEALIDALTFWCAGFRNVTSAYGIEGFTKEHLEAFKRHKTKRVLIAYDRDDAGEKAAASLAKKLTAAGLDCFRIQFPRGMDANEYAQTVQPARRSLELVIRQAAWLGKGKPPERSFAEPIVEVVTSANAETTSAEEPTITAEQPTAEAAAAAETVPAPKAAEAESEAKPLSPLVAEESPVEAKPPASELAATPLPAVTPIDIKAEVTGEEVRIRLGDRRWRIRGLPRNLSFDQLRVNVLVSRSEGGAEGKGSAFFVDTLDLYSARHRALYLKQAAEELALEENVLKRDLGKVLLKLEELQEENIQKTLAPKEQAPKMSPEGKAAALGLLRDPKLLSRILEDFASSGVVGEETNKLVGYLAAVSRKLEEPLAIVIQSSSAAGKTSLMEAVLAFFPEEERVKYSAMTGQSLFYMGEQDLAHKILAIVEEEGAERASYALKLLQSERELTIASTGKDPATGRLITHEYRVEGPVMIFLTTTAIEIDEELQNRCIVLTVDEDREQTRAIHRSQRKQQTLEGLLGRRDREALLEVHRNAQRLLRPLLVANPFAEKLTFLDSRTRTRRDHMKYLTLIRSIALLHQYQRPIKTVRHRGEEVSYIEVTLEDIEVANRLMHEVLGRSLDELAPQTRRLLELISEMVHTECARLDMDRSDYRFTRREVRERSGWGATQLRVHLERLVELEYVLVHHGGRGQQFVYELLYDGEPEEKTHLSGLAELKAIRSPSPTTQTWRGKGGDLAGGWRGHGGPKTGGWRGPGNGQSSKHPAELGAAERKPDGNAHLERAPKGRSYTLRRRSAEAPALGEVRG